MKMRGKPSCAVKCSQCAPHHLREAGYSEMQIEAIIAALPDMRAEGDAPPVQSYEQDGVKSYEQMPTHQAHQRAQ